MEHSRMLLALVVTKYLRRKPGVKKSSRSRVPQLAGVLCLSVCMIAVAVNPIQANGQPPASNVIAVDSANPYFLMQKTYADPRGQVMSGSVVGDCVIESFTQCAKAALPDTYLQGAFLSYSNLRRANLRRSNLKAGSLAFANLTNADLRGSDLSGTALVRAQMRGVDLRGAQLVLNDAAEVIMTRARLNKSVVVGSSFVGADLRRANFSRASVRGTTFLQADLTGASFARADLSNSIFVGAKTAGVNWRGAIFCNTLMPNGSLRGATTNPCPDQPRFGPASAVLYMTPDDPFYPGALAAGKPAAQPYGSVFRGCTLEVKASCPKASLAKANLTNVLLDLSFLERADLRGSTASGLSLLRSQARGVHGDGANFESGGVTGADLRDASLARTVWTFASAALADFGGASLAEANFGFGDLIGSNFTGADLAGADLSNSNAIGAIFTGANLDGTNLANADLTGANLTRASLQGAQFCNTLMPDGSVKAPQLGLCPSQNEPS